MKSNTLTLNATTDSTQMTNMDFRHYIMSDVVGRGHHSVDSDLISKIFSSGKGELTPADHDFVQRRFKSWCDYHGVKLNFHVDTRTGRVVRYDLTV